MRHGTYVPLKRGIYRQIASTERDANDKHLLAIDYIDVELRRDLPTIYSEAVLASKTKQRLAAMRAFLDTGSGIEFPSAGMVCEGYGIHPEVVFACCVLSQDTDAEGGIESSLVL